ncbi:MAG: 2Fe-2S iron-sulfur cluster-binding protein [Thiobacillus sp.]|nr:2Fe-2S iron-sulfur cluster-binding protein [Thiobacillus sp.]
MPSGHVFTTEENDTILQAALRAGIPLSYGCSSGNCGDCLARLVSGEVSKARPYDFLIREADKAKGVLLMCVYSAVGDIVIEANIEGADDIPQQTIATRVKAIEPFDEHILALHLMTPRSQRLRFLAGQSVKLEVNGAAGEYYIASCPCDDRHIELHIRRGRQPFADQAFASLSKDAVVMLTGPAGGFVMKLDSRRPIIFVAWDDGFAPIKSLIQHAMSLEVAESMHFYWLADELAHYQENYVRSLADALDDFDYKMMDTDAEPAQLAERVLANHPDLTHCDIYAAGPAVFLDSLRAAALARNVSALGWHEEVM